MQAPPAVDMTANNQIIDQLQSQVAYMTSELARHQAQAAAQSTEVARLLDENAGLKANSDTVNTVRYQYGHHNTFFVQCRLQAMLLPTCVMIGLC